MFYARLLSRVAPRRSNTPQASGLVKFQRNSFSNCGWICNIYIYIIIMIYLFLFEEVALRVRTGGSSRTCWR
jgi:hypothetical protein